MTRKTGLFLLAGVTAAVAIVFAASFFSNRQSKGIATPGGEPADIVSQAEGAPLRLLFPGSAGMLHGEERQLIPLEAAEQSIRQLIEALLEGPRSEKLHRLFQIEGLSVDVLLTQNSRIYLNLLSTELSSPPPMGTHQEMLTVFALVNSIILNFPEIRGVVLLWNGEQNSTFAGHIDTTRPLSVNTSLIADLPV